jgi:hypothetical protein
MAPNRQDCSLLSLFNSNNLIYAGIRYAGDSSRTHAIQNTKRFRVRDRRIPRGVGGRSRLGTDDRLQRLGLPDNAVKESRERIKSALRNCGFEPPHGQGVTINLAPADVRKEGSGFDLPMALGLVGCMGHFFGKPLDTCMFLGELSLDGSVRSVRGALSAREFGLKAIAVPEPNAREAAVVEGVEVFALKSPSVKGYGLKDGALQVAISIDRDVDSWSIVLTSAGRVPTHH